MCMGGDFRTTRACYGTFKTRIAHRFGGPRGATCRRYRLSIGKRKFLTLTRTGGPYSVDVMRGCG